MVRHSGFFTSLAAIFLAALSVSVLERRSDGSPRIHHGTSVGTGSEASAVGLRTSDPFHGLRDLTKTEASRRSETIRIQVPEKSLIIVGSLDVSGAAHSLLISSEDEEGHIADTGSKPQGVGDVEYFDTAGLSALKRRFEALKPGPVECAMSEISQRPDNSIVIHSFNNGPNRKFLIPYFESDQVVQQPREAVLLSEGSRVRVYLDLCITPEKSDTKQRQQIGEDAQRVCTTIEFEVLPLIERWIGCISDLDADQRLSVVVTDLDRRKYVNDTPILGCVRRGDFSAGDQHPLSGDILYLDRHLPPPEQLRALLAHELTHAAIHCIRHEAPHDSPLKNHSVPSWLNEAAAHWVEQQFCRTPAGYSIREAAFRRSPALCPILLKDDDHSHPARRAGSRVAGATFLHQHLADVTDLRKLLEQRCPFEQAISAVTHAPFSHLFRQWSIHQAVGDQQGCSRLESTVGCCSMTIASSEPIQRRLHGTAFIALNVEHDQLVSIEAPREAQLQFTVLLQETSLGTRYDPVNLTAASPQTAKLKSQSPFTKR